MGTLHMAPVLLLGFVALWLMWPVVVEPSLRRLRALRRPRVESADSLSEELFGAWSKRGAMPRRAEPLRHG